MNTNDSLNKTLNETLNETPASDAPVGVDVAPEPPKVEAPKVNLREMPKEDRATQRDEILKLIMTKGAVRNSEIAKMFGLSYSQIYLPLRRVKTVAQAYPVEGGKRQMHWVALNEDGTPAANVPGDLKVVPKTEKAPAEKPEPTPAPVAKKVKKAPAKKAAPVKKAVKKKAPAKKKKAPAKKAAADLDAEIAAEVAAD